MCIKKALDLRKSLAVVCSVSNWARRCIVASNESPLKRLALVTRYSSYANAKNQFHATSNKIRHRNIFVFAHGTVLSTCAF